MKFSSRIPSHKSFKKIIGITKGYRKKGERKVNTKRISIVIVSLIILCLFFEQPGVQAETVTEGGEKAGVPVPVRHIKRVHQNKFDNATDLHFKVWQKMDNVNVTGWRVEISNFTSSSSQRSDQPEPYHSKIDNHPAYPKTNNPDNGQHAIDVFANGAIIRESSWVKINVTFWQTNKTCDNRITWSGANWTKGAEKKKAEPDNGWGADLPQQHSKKPGVFYHNWTFTNYDTVDNVTVSGLTFLPTMVWYENLTDIIFPYPPYLDFTLRPGESWFIIINDTYSLVGGHIYFKYSIKASEEHVSENWADHPVTEIPPSALTITTTPGGTTDPPLGTHHYSYPTVVSVLAIPTPCSGYIFDHWELDGVNVGALNPLDTPPFNHTLHAVFALKPYVGGYSVSIGKPKPDMSVPYMGLASAMAVAVLTTAIYVKRRKKKR